MDIRISLGSAAVLGLTQARMLDRPTTCYLLMSGQCSNDCGFCPQARSGEGNRKWLSRVSWPTFELKDLLRLEQVEQFQYFSRICIQTVLNQGWIGKMQELLTQLQITPGLEKIPISCSAIPGSVDEVGQLLDSGLERIGIPLDAATPWIYRKVKSGDFSRAYRLVKESGRRYPGRVSTHLIIGLGETEQEVAAVLQELSANGVLVGLFAFTPVAGTRLAGLPQPPLGQYRRLQVLRYLLGQGLPVQLSFTPEGRISDFGYSPSELEGLLSAGTAFRTSGCPGCNRPYYNERPGQTPYNYPRPLSQEEVQTAFAELFR